MINIGQCTLAVIMDKMFFVGLIILLVGLAIGLIAFIIHKDPAPDDLPFAMYVVFAPLSIVFTISGPILMLHALM